MEATMPYEEDRESFFARLQPSMTRRTFSLIKLAYQMAKFNHRWQRRKQTDENGEPIRYFEHLRGVALILIDEVGCCMPAMVIASLMHDSLEDTRDVSEDDLETWFGSYGMEVCRIVRLLSKKPGVNYLERLAALGDWKVLLIKACDRLHNLRSLEGTGESFQRKIATETLEHHLTLLGAMFQTIPTCYMKSAARIMFEMEDLAKKYAPPEIIAKHDAPFPHWSLHRLAFGD